MTYDQITTTLNQLGGKRFEFMVGLKDLTNRENGFSFKITRNKTRANRVTITLGPSDTYSIKFEYVSFSQKTFEHKCKTVAEYNHVYADQLIDIFQDVTGLATYL